MDFLNFKKVFLILKLSHFFADIRHFKNSYFSKLEFRSRNVCEHSLEEKMEWNWIFEGELIEKTSSRMLFHKHSIFSSFFIFEISRGNILSNPAPRTFLKRYFVHFDCSAKAMYCLTQCLENLDTVLREYFVRYIPLRLQCWSNILSSTVPWELRYSA